jgi:hypothetical protein
MLVHNNPKNLEIPKILLQTKKKNNTNGRTDQTPIYFKKMLAQDRLKQLIKQLSVHTESLRMATYTIAY